jgi:hypothetical protein
MNNHTSNCDSGQQKNNYVLSIKIPKRVCVFLSKVLSTTFTAALTSCLINLPHHSVVPNDTPAIICPDQNVARGKIPISK